MKEEKTTDSKLLDSTILIAYFIDGEHQETIDSEETLYISLLSLFEVKRKLLEKKVPEKEVKEKSDFIKKRTIVLTLNNAIAEKAANISINHKVPAMDALIYVTALFNKKTLVTCDNDFRNLQGVQIITTPPSSQPSEDI